MHEHGDPILGFHIHILRALLLNGEVDMTDAFHRLIRSTIHSSQQVVQEVIVLSRVYGYLIILYSLSPWEMSPFWLALSGSVRYKRTCTIVW